MTADVGGVSETARAVSLREESAGRYRALVEALTVVAYAPPRDEPIVVPGVSPHIEAVLRHAPGLACLRKPLTLHARAHTGCAVLAAT
jgi:hypothetical protein